MPPETPEALADRLLVVTLALAQTEDPPELAALFHERGRILEALASQELPDSLSEPFAKVMRAERAALQAFAQVRAQAVRDLDRRSAGRKLPRAYGRPSSSGSAYDTTR